jgi:hypothetical protein
MIVREKLERVSSDSYQWNVNFLKAAHNWKVDVFTLFFNLLYPFRLRQSSEDKLCWVHFKKGLFDVKILLQYPCSP